MGLGSEICDDVCLVVRQVEAEISGLFGEGVGHTSAAGEGHRGGGGRAQLQTEESEDQVDDDGFGGEGSGEDGNKQAEESTEKGSEDLSEDDGGEDGNEQRKKFLDLTEDVESFTLGFRGRGCGVSRVVLLVASLWGGVPRGGSGVGGAACSGGAVRRLVSQSGSRQKGETQADGG